MKLLAAPDKSRRPSKSDKLSDAPLSLARAYERHLRPVLTGKGGEKFMPQVLCHFREEYYWWDGSTYWVVPRKRVHNDLYRFLDGLDMVGVSRGSYKCQPDVNLVKKVLDALDGVCECKADSIPSWLNDTKIPSENILAFENGLLDVGSYLSDGNDTLIPLTPEWFSTNVFPHKFIPRSTCPLWLKYVSEVFEGDQKQADLLQEWFGYCLSGDTRREKFMIAVGLGGTGKTTASNVLKRIIGKNNSASPTFRQLGSRFGLHPLVGKTLAVIGDGHIGKNTDPMAVLEIIKLITGRDEIDIDRKSKDALSNIRLGVRLHINFNEIPYFPDSTGTLMRRLLVLRFDRSFVGIEDTNLEDKLVEETPGIILWALEGLARLNDNGRFTETEQAADAIRDIKRTNSPMHSFIEDEIVLPANAREHGKDPAKLTATSEELWTRFEVWRKEDGRLKDLAKNSFFKKFKEILNKQLQQDVDQRRLGPRNEREQAYTGVAVRIRLSELPT